MATNLKGKDLISVDSLSAADIQRIITLARKQKREWKSGKGKPALAGKSFVLYFEKPSLRTRVSFQVGIAQLGGASLYLSSEDTHATRGEPMEDTGRVLSRYADGIIYRAYAHDQVQLMADAASVPVINALSDFSHPCQAMADLLTIYEKKGKKKHIKVAYVGDGNNVAHSLIYTLTRVGIDLTIAVPKGYDPDKDVVARGRQDAAAAGANFQIVRRPADAVRDADVVYTDVWVSMGMEKEEAQRRKAFKGFFVTPELMALAKPDAIFMHDLPAHRGEEVHEDVMESPQSVIFDQAENRLHAQKAVLTLLCGD
jgi:ornithine carbamoyltransferase